jgi:predicted phage tail protein
MNRDRLLRSALRVALMLSLGLSALMVAGGIAQAGAAAAPTTSTSVTADDVQTVMMLNPDSISWG